MIPKTVLCNADGDIDLSQGLRFTSTLTEYVAQRLDENLSFFLAEWFLDQRKGIPYHQKIIGQKPDLALIDSLFRRACLLTAGVAAVRALRVTFDPSNRSAKPSIEVVTKEGETVTAEDLRKGFFVSV